MVIGILIVVMGEGGVVNNTYGYDY